MKLVIVYFTIIEGLNNFYNILSLIFIRSSPDKMAENNRQQESFSIFEVFRPIASK